MKPKRQKSAREKSEAKKPDWEHVIAYVERVETTERVAKDNDFAQFQRMQKFVRECGPFGDPAAQLRLRNGVLEIAKTFQLETRQCARLFKSLAELKCTFDFESEWEKQPKGTATAREINQRIGKSLKRIADFAATENPRKEFAIMKMISIGDLWAQKQNKSELRRLGFDESKGRSDIRNHLLPFHGSAGVVRTWFELAPLIHRWASEAQRELSKSKAVLFADEGVTPIVRLVGGALPELYQVVTGQDFKISNVLSPADEAKQEGVRNIRGVKFVRLSLKAMGMDELAPETVASYRKKYKKGMSSKNMVF